MSEKKIIRLNQTVFSLAEAYPEMIQIMHDLGFHDIVKPGMLKTAGRFMTLEKGAKMKNIDLETVISRLEAAGFTVSR